MRAFKFLDGHGRAPFTGAVWTPGTWVDSTRAVACREGVHACRPRDLAHWLASSLWEVELDGEIVQSRHKVVASRGRLVRQIGAYGDAVRELAEVGARRCRDRAALALRAEGATELADRLAAASSLEALAALGVGLDESTHASTAAALAADAAVFALRGTPAQSPFVAACGAGHARAGSAGDQAAYDIGYAEERAYQSAWLSERLGLG